MQRTMRVRRTLLAGTWLPGVTSRGHTCCCAFALLGGVTRIGFILGDGTIAQSSSMPAAPRRAPRSAITTAAVELGESAQVADWTGTHALLLADPGMLVVPSAHDTHTDGDAPPTPSQKDPTAQLSQRTAPLDMSR